MAWGMQGTGGRRRTRGYRRNVGRVPAQETSELGEDSTKSQCSRRCRCPICHHTHSNSFSNTPVPPSLGKITRCMFYPIPGGPQPAAHRGGLFMNTPCSGLLSSLLPLAYPPSSLSWDHLPHKLLTLKTLSLSLLGSPHPKQVT